MAVTSSPIFIQTVGLGVAQILPADTTTLKTLYTAGANGSMIDNIIISSTETANARDVAFYITISAVDYLIGTISIPVNTGFTNGIAPISLLKHANMVNALSIDSAGNQVIKLPIGSVLKVKCLTTVAAGKALQFVCQGGDL
jgi:hypothetical protein